MYFTRPVALSAPSQAYVPHDGPPSSATVAARGDEAAPRIGGQAPLTGRGIGREAQLEQEREGHDGQDVGGYRVERLGKIPELARAWPKSG